MNKLQYTIRNIPPQVDKVMRKRAKRYGKSFNSVLVDAITKQALGDEYNKSNHKSVFDRLYGSGTFDKGFDEAIADQSGIDEDLWL